MISLSEDGDKVQGIKNYSTFTKIELINKGWSSDQKYYIETEQGSKLLLRVADISQYDQKASEYALMEQGASLGVPMSQPLELGICGLGKSVYSLYTWCDGEDAEAVLPSLTEAEQYALGVKSGEILRLIHSIPPPKEQEAWETRFNRKTDNKIEKYNACEIKFTGDDKVIDYLEKNRHLLYGRPQCFQHGDYHAGNMVIAADNGLFIIDFNRFDFGDPWEEFNRIVFSAAVSPHFAAGQLNGYFGGRPPQKFFQLLAFYIASNTLSAIPWAISFGEKEIAVMKKQAQDVLTWFDNMNNPVPSWYLEAVNLK